LYRFFILYCGLQENLKLQCSSYYIPVGQCWHRHGIDTGIGGCILKASLLLYLGLGFGLSFHGSPVKDPFEKMPSSKAGPKWESGTCVLLVARFTGGNSSGKRRLVYWRMGDPQVGWGTENRWGQLGKDNSLLSLELHCTVFSLCSGKTAPPLFQKTPPLYT
jgi:hypothetical protein